MSPASNLIACHDCDLLQRDIAPLPGSTVVCPRCGATHYRYHPYNRDRALALSLAAAILFLIANLFPIVGIESQGNRNSTTLLGAVHTLWHDGMPLVASLVLVTTVLAPAFELALVIWLLLAPRPTPLPLRFVLTLQPWRMVEVFMLGLLVSVVKLSHLASIEPGVALWAFAALLPLFAMLTTTFNPRDLWASMAPR